MLTLNTLRTRFGIVLSIVIVLALLAFILSLGPEMGLFGDDRNPTVAEIDGEEISYVEYSKEYQTANTAYTFLMQGQQQNAEYLTAQVAAETWGNMLMQYYFIPAMEDIGIEVTEEEAQAMLLGTVNSDTYQQWFGPAYATTIPVFLQNFSAPNVPAEQKVAAETAWNYLKGQALQNRYFEKYATLMKAGAYVNSLEVEQALKAANNVVDGRYVTVRLNTIADDEVAVKDSEVKAYYDSHKELYRKLPGRNISYVLFDVMPTPEDEQAIEANIHAIAEELKAAEDKTQVQAIILNNMGRLSSSYLPQSKFSDEESVLFDGQVYGPTLNNDEWVVTHAIKEIEAPDSIGISMIVVGGENANATAEKVYADAVAGEQFDTLAEKHNLPAENSVDGVAAFSDLANLFLVDATFAEKLAQAKEGDVLKHQTTNMIQIVKVDRMDKKQKHILTGSVVVPVEASSATVTSISSEAAAFAAKAKGSVAAFNKAASESSVMPRTATIAEGDYIMPSLENSRQLVRWAQGAEVGAISEVFEAGDSYVVAIVTAIDKNKYEPLTGSVKTVIAKELMDRKRMDILKKEYAGLTIEEAAAKAEAEVKEFAGVRYSDVSLGSDMYGELGVVGAVTTTPVTSTAQVVRANNASAAVIYVVDAVAQPETPQTAEAEKLRLQTNIDAYSIQNGAGQAISSIINNVETMNNSSIYF